MNWTINQTVDLSRGYTPVVWPDALMVSGDVGAHTWRVAVLDNGVPADLSGATITGSFLRADGNTVTVAGSVSGNTAIVTLTDVCYAVEGKMKGTIKMTKSGAVITLAAVIFTVSLFTSGSVIDPGVAYADFQIDASPAGTYADLSALIADDPNHSRIYITLDDGKWCYHNGTTFVAGGVYQATEVPNKSITPVKTSFYAQGKNLFDYTTAVPGYAVNSVNGELAENALFTASAYMPVEPSTTYMRSQGYAWAAYDAQGDFISGGTDNPLTTPPGARMLRTCFRQDSKTYQVEQGSVATAYEPYRAPYIPASEMEQLSAEEIDGLLVENLYDLKDVSEDTTLSSADGQTVAAAGFVTSGYIPVKQNMPYFLARARVIAYYDKDHVFLSSIISSQFNMPSFVTSPPHARYLRTSYYPMTDSAIRDNLYLDQMQVVEGALARAFVPHGQKVLPHELMPSKPALLALPQKMHAVVGKEMPLYFDNVVLNDIGPHYIDVVSAKGKHQADRWLYVPAQAETTVMVLRVCDLDGHVRGEALTTVVAKAASVGTGVSKTALVIGDSTINAGLITQRMLDLFAVDPMGLTLIGSRGSGDNRHEGRGGWGFESYRKATVYSDVVNPFYNAATNDFDFGHYMTTKGYAAPDYVVINLGINDMFAFTDDTTANAAIDQMLVDSAYIISSIHAYSTSIKVGLCATIPPSASQNAFADYGNSDQTAWRCKRNNYLWVKRLLDTYKNREADGIHVVPINVCIDRTADFADHVHPAATGYQRIGDSLYYWIKSFEV